MLYLRRLTRVPRDVIDLFAGNIWSAKGVLLLSLVFTFLVWQLSYQFVSRTIEHRFVEETDDIASSIRDRVNRHAAILNGGGGLFAANGELTRAQWNAYFERLDTQSFVPGLLSFGYAKITPDADLPSAIAAQQTDGAPDFALSPPGQRPFYVLTTLVEPMHAANRAVLGFDVWTEAMRREAMERARDSGKVALSGKTALPGTGKEASHPGVVMYLPVYRRGVPLDSVEDRRLALEGYVFSRFHINDLMLGILGAGRTDIEYDIFDGDTPSLANQLYDSKEASGTANVGRTLNQRVHSFDVAGRTWTVVFRTHKNYITEVEEAQPVIIAASGIAIDILLFFVLQSAFGHRRRAEEAARAMTVDLQRAKETAENLAGREQVARLELERINKELIDANMSLSRFTSVAAHDLRAPLRRIDSFVEILEEDHAPSLNDEGLDILSRIRRGTERMSAMVTSLLLYTKAGTSGLSFTDVDLRGVVKGVLANFDLKAQDVTIDVDVEDGVTVRGEASLLGSVFNNLIGNAIKFRSAEPVRIQVSARRLDDGRISVAVSDNGIGIDEKHAPNVFDMFFRLHNESQYRGTGIGLAICKRIVTDHGGKIDVDPSYRNGTRIVFTLAGPNRASGAAAA